MYLHDFIIFLAAFLLGIVGAVLVVAKHPKMAVGWICTYVAKGKATLGEIHESIDAKIDAARARIEAKKR